jgi:hypothetical protein
MTSPVWVASVLFWTLTLLVTMMTVVDVETNWLAYAGWIWIARGWIDIEDDERVVVVVEKGYQKMRKIWEGG